MESKLKALKVTDLKAILTKAGLDTSGKKQDLITRVLENQSAREIVEPSANIPSEVQAAQPVVSSPPTAPPAVSPPSQDTTPIAAAVQPSVISPNASDSTPDDDLEKRRKRAERFGIPLVETAKPKADIGGTNSSADQLQARAQRFGTGITSGGNGSVGNAGAVDAEEAERRRKRAERFG